MLSVEEVFTKNSIFEVINEDNIDKYISVRINEIIDVCLGNEKYKKSKIIENFLLKDRTILNAYIENDFKKLKDKIIHTRKMCVNRREIDLHVNTLDYQIQAILNSNNHMEFLKNNLKNRFSEDRMTRREFNIDLHDDIFDYFIEQAVFEQGIEIWNLYN